jgi:integrase
VHQVSPGTRAKYDHHLDQHILPVFGQVRLDQIRRMAVKEWAADLAVRYAPATVSSIVTLLSVVLNAAVQEQVIAVNPCLNLKISSRTSGGNPRHGRPIPQERHILPLAARAGRLGGRTAEILVLTAAFTGMRWGELAGLARPNCRTSENMIWIHADVGALHEVRGQLWLGPPKSPAAVRRIDLPPFLVRLLEETMDAHGDELVFAGAEGGRLRRSNFARRIWRPVCDDGPQILPGAVFHGLRHLHKSVLMEAGIPRVLQFERLGHELGGMDGVYGHVTEAMRTRLVDELQRRWRRLGKRQKR